MLLGYNNIGGSASFFRHHFGGWTGKGRGRNEGYDSDCKKFDHGIPLEIEFEPRAIVKSKDGAVGA